MRWSRLRRRYLNLSAKDTSLASLLFDGLAVLLAVFATVLGIQQLRLNNRQLEIADKQTALAARQTELADKQLELSLKQDSIIQEQLTKHPVVEPTFVLKEQAFDRPDPSVFITINLTNSGSRSIERFHAILEVPKAISDRVPSTNTGTVAPEPNRPV